ncbi:MAG TPA: response regulator [Acidobacteriota bacterium]|nr:response regulator [Acidobacteriota bacterium]HNC42753.1 response regulator [Acidobacteriota bacterium]HNG91162.1 response regulator [Acidobacteriota bacterium]HNH80985.1 response regulator [Acidobacteriota bacterium]
MTKQRRILVIDDEELIRRLIVEIIELEGFEAISAEHGLQGVEFAKTYQPDLIICDVTMPYLDGLGTLAALRKDPQTASIPFIFLTAKIDHSDIRQGMNLGADDYLPKPVGRDELVTAIRAQFQKHSWMRDQYEKKMEELRRNISSSLPHELRTPLNGILGMSELVLDAYDTFSREEILEMVRDIHTSARRLHRLVENFWVYAKLETLCTDPGHLELIRKQAQTYSAKSIIEKVAVTKARDFSRIPDLHLTVADEVIRISDSHLAKVVEELLENAFKYSIPGTPVIVTGTTGPETYLLRVTEQGRGMTANQIADIGAYMQFERTIYEQQGAGLGLAIVQRIVELNEGRLHIESVPDQQTTVEVEIPKLQLTFPNTIEYV